LEKEYKNSWEYIKSSRNFVWVVIAIFVVSAFSAILFPTPDQVSQQINQFMQEIVEKTKGMSASELSGYIFLNNLQSSFMGVALGIVLGIFPVIFAISNGYIIGFVANMSVEEEGILSLWKLLPHGIFELPAVFISFALGLRLGSSLINKDEFGSLKENLVKSGKTFLLIIIPLLVIAAIIEGVLIFLGR
ncbi:MAG: stage II sporulation protein M, partial [Candidatus Pacearchaeota archaeon]